MNHLKSYYSCTKHVYLMCDHDSNCIKCLELESNIYESWSKRDFRVDNKLLVTYIEANK